MQCRNCGKENSAENKFCIFCGQLIEDAENKEPTMEENNSIAENHSEHTIVSDTRVEAQEEYIPVVKTKENKKQRPKFLVPLVALILVSSIAGAGFIWYKGTQSPNNKKFEENYKLDTMLGFKYTDWDDVSNCELYINTVGGDERLIAKGINSQQYAYSDVSGALAYVDNDNTLYVAKSGEEAIRVSKDVEGHYFYFSEDGTKLFFHGAADFNQLYCYDIKSDNKTLLIDGDREEVYIDEANEEVYYQQGGDLYKRDQDGNDKKIGENVEQYRVLDTEQVLCKVSGGSTNYVIYHNKGKKVVKEEIKDIDYIRLVQEQESEKQDIICFLGELSSEGNIPNLYMKLEGQQPVKIADNVQYYSYCRENNNFYYLTNAGILYRLEIPKINKKCFNDREYFERVIDKSKTTEVLDNCMYINASPDHKHVIAKTHDGILYLIRNNMKFKLAHNVLQENVFNDHIVYRTEDNKLFVQEGISKDKLEKLEDPILVTDKIEADYMTSLYGKYLTYLIAEGEGNNQKTVLKTYSKDTGSVTMLEDADTYDVVVANRLTYNRKLKYEEVVGIYACEDYNYLVKMEADGAYRVYSGGEEKGSTIQTYAGTSRSTLIVQDGDQEELIANLTSYDPYDNYVVMGVGSEITLDQDGNCEVYAGGTYYYLTPITEEQFNQKLDEQKKQEEERQRLEEERRRQEELERQRQEALEQRANQYYISGVFLSANTSIYSDHDYSSSTYYHTINGNTWLVYDYYIDYVNSIIWVKIQHTPSGSYYSEEGWVPMT